jgi:hypothetical protein
MILKNSKVHKTMALWETGDEGNHGPVKQSLLFLHIPRKIRLNIKYIVAYSANI